MSDFIPGLMPSQRADSLKAFRNNLKATGGLQLFDVAKWPAWYELPQQPTVQMSAQSCGLTRYYTIWLNRTPILLTLKLGDIARADAVGLVQAGCHQQTLILPESSGWPYFILYEIHENGRGGEIMVPIQNPEQPFMIGPTVYNVPIDLAFFRNNSARVFFWLTDPKKPPPPQTHKHNRQTTMASCYALLFDWGP